MRIAIDFDGVLNRFDEATIHAINYHHDKDYSVEDIKGWNIDEYLDVTKEQLFNIWTPKFIENIPFRAGAKEMIDSLKAMGHEVIIATACFHEVHGIREKKCIEQLGLNLEDIVFIKKKYLLDVDVLVDDAVHNFYDNYDLPIKAEKIVFDRAYNRNIKDLRCYYRVKELSEILNTVRIIEKKKFDNSKK